MSLSLNDEGEHALLWSSPVAETSIFTEVGTLNTTPSPEILTRIVKYPRSATIFAAVCCILFIVVGILGNLATVLALSCSIKLRNATTAFVISLASSDLLFCAINLPMTASRYIHEEWLLGDTLCTLFPFFFYGNVATSLMCMTAITINRYILINHYNLYDKIYRRRYIMAMIVFCWIFSFSMLIPSLTRVWGQLGYDRETFSCTIRELNGRSPKKFFFVLGFLLPCGVIVISYSCIFYKVLLSRRNVSAYSPTSPSVGARAAHSARPFTRQNSSLRADEVRLTRMMLIIFCSFLVCFLPLMVVNVFDNDTRYPLVHVLASVLAWMSSVINPFIYALMSRQYRQAYVRMFCPTRWRHQVNGAAGGVCGGGSSSHNRSYSGTSSNTASKTFATDVFIFGACTDTKNGSNNNVKHAANSHSGAIEMKEVNGELT